MFCKHCGNEIADQAVVCPRCGIAVDKAFFQNPKQSNIAQENSGNAVAIAGFVLALVGAFFGLFGLFLSVTPMFFSFACVVIAGLVCSIVGLVRARRNKKQLGLAIAGVVISIGFFVITITLYLLAVALAYGILALFSLLFAGF